MQAGRWLIVKQIQLRYERHATSGGRRRRVDCVPVVNALDWIAFDREVPCHVVHGHRIALSSEIGDQPLCDFTSVKSVRTTGCYGPQRPGQVGVPKCIARYERRTVGKEDFAATLVLLEAVLLTC